VTEHDSHDDAKTGNSRPRHSSSDDESLRLRGAGQESSADFSGLYAGQAAALGRELPAGELTLKLAAESLQRLGALGRAG